MARALPRSYADVSHWRAYQELFPPDLRCEGDSLPEESFWQWRGLDVHLDRYPAPAAPLKLIVVHGAGGYGRLFAACGLMARQANAEVVAPDLPGYGLTRVARAYTHADWVDCVADLVQAERARDHRPVVLLGGSMGGMVAYAVAARGNVAGVIATCLLDPRRAEVRRAVARAPWLATLSAPLLPLIGAALGPLRIPIRTVTKMRAMSGNEKLVELVATDPCGGGNTVSLRFLASFLSWRPPVDPSAFTVCPVLVTHPANDTWTPPALTRDFFDQLACPKQWVLLENAGHFPIEEPGLWRLRESITAFLAERALGQA